MATSKVKGYETNSLMSAWTGYQKYLMWEKVLQNSFTSNVRKNTSKLTYILLKLRKCGAKHATSTDQKIARVSPSGEGGGGGLGGSPPLPEKLACPPPCPPPPPLLCPKNADFVIFMQFLFPNQLTSFEKFWWPPTTKVFLSACCCKNGIEFGFLTLTSSWGYQHGFSAEAS